jgi:hypothetical protein
MNTDTPTRRKTALQLAADARAPYAAKIVELERERAELIAALETAVTELVTLEPRLTASYRLNIQALRNHLSAALSRVQP